MFLITLFHAVWPVIGFFLKCLAIYVGVCLLASILASTIKRTPEEQAEWDKKWEEHDRNSGPPYWGDPN